MHIDIPFLTKLNTKVEPTLDTHSSKLYDKGENIYISLDGTLTADKFTLLPTQAFTQMGMLSQSFYTITKECFNHRVLIIKVPSIWPHLDHNIKEDLHYMQLMTQNKLLNKYAQLPSLIFPYLTRIILTHKQVVFIEDTILFIAEGIVYQNGKQVHQYCEGQVVAITECRLYALHKTRYPISSSLWRVNQELMLGSAVLQFDSPKYPQHSVIKDLKVIKQMLKGEDYSQLRHKLNEVFGRKSNEQQPIISIQQLQQQSCSVRQRTQSCQEENNNPSKKPIFRKVHIGRQMSKDAYQEQPQLCVFQKINYSPLRNRQSRVKMNNSQQTCQKTTQELNIQQQQTLHSQQQQQCLPIIKSFVNPEEFQQQQQILKKKQGQYKKKIYNKFVEFDKIMNQLIK